MSINLKTPVSVSVSTGICLLGALVTAKLLNLQEQLHKRVVGQSSAVSAVANAVIRSRAGLAASERGSSFLFLGPTGACRISEHLEVLPLNIEDVCDEPVYTAPACIRAVHHMCTVLPCAVRSCRIV